MIQTKEEVSFEGAIAIPMLIDHAFRDLGMRFYEFREAAIEFHK
jgi:hypothetical protein